MRFEYYQEGLLDVPKLSVDGTVPNSIHFSHWQGNETPAQLKADTSTEIALNLVASPVLEEFTRGIDLVTNNHFDTDGVLSVWTMLAGERALELRERLIRAAEAGDFSEWSGDDGVRASLAIQGSDQPTANEETLSPLANHLAGRTVTDEREAYEFVLPEVERLMTRTGDYEPLWRAAWQRIEAADDSFARGRSSVDETKGKLSVITLAPEIYGSSGFNPTQHAVPSTVISRYARGQLFLIATEAASGGWFYRVDYPYYSWAETVVRPRILRRNISPVVSELNELEADADGGRWSLDTSELASAMKFLTRDGVPGASRLEPEAVAARLRSALLVEAGVAQAEGASHV